MGSLGTPSIWRIDLDKRICYVNWLLFKFEGIVWRFEYKVKIEIYDY